MATKYVRNNYSDHASGSHPDRFPPRWHRNMDPKRRLLLIYVGLGIATILLLVAHFLGLTQAKVWSELEVGNGVILNKTILNEATDRPIYMVSVGIGLPEGETPVGENEAGVEMPFRRGNLIVDAPSWRRVEAGSAVRATFQVEQRTHRVRIVALALDNGGGS